MPADLSRPPAIITIIAMLSPLRDRIHLARRAAHVGRLTDRGLSPEAAERAVAAWEVEAETRGLDRQAPDYWTQGETPYGVFVRLALLAGMRRGELLGSARPT